MKKVTMLAAAIAAVTAMPGFATTNIAESSMETTIHAHVYDLMEITGLSDRHFEAAFYREGQDYVVNDRFRVVRRGAPLIPGSFKLTIDQVDGSGPGFSLNGGSKGTLDMSIAVSDKRFGDDYTEMTNGNPETFRTNKGFSYSGKNMRVKYTIPEHVYLGAESGGYKSTFKYTVAAI